MDEDAIRERLADVVRRAGGRDAIAETLEVDRSSVDSWFGGKRKIPLSAETYVTLAKALNVSLDWLLLNRGQINWVSVEPATARRQLLDAVDAELNRASEEDNFHGERALIPGDGLSARSTWARRPLARRRSTARRALGSRARVDQKLIQTTKGHPR